MSKELIDKIGMPAALELLAEECVELSHACLKMARIKRCENPTPLTEEKVMPNLNEEIADVLLCIDALVDYGFISNESIESVRIAKNERWKNRVK